MNEKTARKGQKCNDERKTCKKRALATLHSFVLQSRTVPLCINGQTGAKKKMLLFVWEATKRNSAGGIAGLCLLLSLLAVQDG
jgi:hypothetical protein